jgi:hypothetical protein
LGPFLSHPCLGEFVAYAEDRHSTPTWDTRSGATLGGPECFETVSSAWKKCQWGVRVWIQVVCNGWERKRRRTRGLIHVFFNKNGLNPDGRDHNFGRDHDPFRGRRHWTTLHSPPAAL